MILGFPLNIVAWMTAFMENEHFEHFHDRYLQELAFPIQILNTV
jgi:hypothetical protein